uniref:NADH-ubiquinone oxidoreductase chain 4L n=1 Tax=Urosaurus nigricauda TaxID=3148767 RepID=A0A4V1GPK9_9SAUR|nr:NADH dehydrogenase subunit 4L [Urosaurus nigricaudus]QCT81406.1 NADH dehydrogenase subunit 4L [Urosaurus nigricaudus]QCT81432.1 NADH dehydrogenase subunit 4L [Urosaurus nigricaudus]QCT81445.1 NADH dehydrogenase subunit 4L [Urosaurus nigricaudus]QCT81458.1 NADH dehydrogenase subunit 4L [Urosaurus nigricaudus]
MSPMHFTLNSTFALSIMGFSMHRTHLVSALLCIEGMMLVLFTTITMFFSAINLPTMSPAPIMLLAFSACEASTGLALLVATSRTHGNDHLKNLNLLQC